MELNALRYDPVLESFIKQNNSLTTWFFRFYISDFQIQKKKSHMVSCSAIRSSSLHLSPKITNLTAYKEKKSLLMNSKMKWLGAISAAFLIGSSGNSVYANETEIPQEIIQTQAISNDWTFIQQVNGIAVYYSIIQLGDERFLSIQFENTSAHAVDFIWSMTKHNSPIAVTIDEMLESRVQLTPYASEIIEGTSLIEITDADQFTDFIVSILPTK